MGTFSRLAAGLALVAVVRLPASGQATHCTTDRLIVGGIPVTARFCIPAEAAADVNISETFAARGKTIAKTTPLEIVAGARTSRTIDDVDLSPIGPKSSLHMTLAYRAGYVELEHALALPGAIPLK